MSYEFSPRLWGFAGLLILGSAVVAGLVLFNSSASRVTDQAEAPGLRSLAFEDVEGNPQTIAAFAGRATMINVWATWCAPCRKEMPELDRLQQELGDERFQVVTLSIDRTGKDAVLPFFEEIGIQALDVYLDPAMSVMATAGVVGLPTTILLDASGEEVYRWVGPRSWDSPEAHAALGNFLKTGDVAQLDLPSPK